MKWHDYHVTWKPLAERMGIKGGADGAIQQVVKKIMRRSGKNAAAPNSCIHLIGEHDWIKDGRPYYDLYPTIVPAFTKVDLTGIKCEFVKLPVPRLLIRLAEGSDPKIKTILVVQRNDPIHMVGSHQAGGPAILIAIQDGTIFREKDKLIDGMMIHTINAVRLIPGQTIIERLKYGWTHPYADDTDVDSEMVERAFQIAITICLLGDNPDLIEPLPLEADFAKYENADVETRLKLLDKARRRGKTAWAVGRCIEVAPGFRSPHFAIRWMGHGWPKTPVVRPVKGCIVRRSKLTEIPTGYLDDIEKML